MLDTLLVALVISVDTAQVKEFPQKAEVEFKKNDLKENIIKSALNFHNSGKKDDKTWNWKIQDVRRARKTLCLWIRSRIIFWVVRLRLPLPIAAVWIRLRHG